MELSSRKFKRVRPLLGTYFGISIANDQSVEDFFTLAADLEAELSMFQPESTISRLNNLTLGESLNSSQFFARVFAQASKIRELSDRAFEPFAKGAAGDLKFQRSGTFTKRGICRLDLNGIAKGAIVDEISHAIEERFPGESAVVNAGGDMRFIGPGPLTAQIRMGFVDRPLYRTISPRRRSLATSSPLVAASRADSTTIYRKKPLRIEGCTVSVVADDCAIADALTKVGLFACPHRLSECAEQLKASIYVFDSNGALVESYGEP